MNNKTDIWLTPNRYFEPLGKFDLDPCAYFGRNIADQNYYDGGLSKEWFGRVWLNPPYSEVSKWLDRLAYHGRGIALVFARTDTRWAQKHMSLADSVFFLAGRIKFMDQNCKEAPNSAGHGSMYLAYGESPKWPFNGLTVKKEVY